MESEAINKLNEGIDKAVAYFEDELKKLRTGRAHPGMLEGVKAEAYGQEMPLIQLATITAPEPQLLQLTPFDPNNLEAIVAAIRDNQMLGMNPMDDGRVVRVPIPPLTEERRKQIAKQLGEKSEECMIAVRGARHDAIKLIDQAKKDKTIGEDEYSRISKRIDEIVTKTKTDVEAKTKAKENEVMTL